MSKSIGILYRLRDIYPRAVSENVYNALITSHFNYCISYLELFCQREPFIAHSSERVLIPDAKSSYYDFLFFCY